MFLESLEKVLADHVTGAAVRLVEAGAPAAALWRPIEEAGFLDLMLPEHAGGAGMALPELFPILECLGRYCVPVPVAQAIVARALVGTRAALPAGMIGIAPRLQRAVDGTLRCPQAPYGMLVEHLLVADGDALLLLACAQARRESVGDPRSLAAHLSWQDAAPVLALPGAGAALAPFAAAMAAAMLSGAMQRAFDMTLAHCNVRVQFGKPIGKFQALQQQLAVMAEHVLAAAIAAEAAFRIDRPVPDELAAAMAKSRTSEAVVLVAATAHAVHGAIGMTDEFDLGIVTRRLHDWRMAYGAEHHWNLRVGEQVLASQATLADFVQAV